MCLKGLKGKIYFSPCFFRLLSVSQSRCSRCAGFCVEVASFFVLFVWVFHMATAERKIFF